jgi:predicted nuclease of predicted toxin-antitoxin system
VQVRHAVGSGASDQVVLEQARGRGDVIVTADTDFGTLIARSGTLWLSHATLALHSEAVACYER